jgi:hypothetical protein
MYDSFTSTVLTGLITNLLRVLLLCDNRELEHLQIVANEQWNLDACVQTMLFMILQIPVMHVY